MDRLKNLFQAGGVRTQLAFISSCSSELSGNAFVEAGVPHVVAVKVKEAVAGKISAYPCFRKGIPGIPGRNYVTRKGHLGCLGYLVETMCYHRK